MVLEGSGAEQGWRLSEIEEHFPGQGSQAVLGTRDQESSLQVRMAATSVINTAD